MAFGNGGTVSGYSASSPINSLPPPIETPSKIRDGISYVEQQIAALHELIEAFERRLDTVLAPIPPSTTDGRGTNVSRQPMSHVQDRLATMSESLSSAKFRLSSLLDRVEV